MKFPIGGKVRERLAQNWCDSNTDSDSLDERSARLFEQHMGHLKGIFLLGASFYAWGIYHPPKACYNQTFGLKGRVRRK